MSDHIKVAVFTHYYFPAFRGGGPLQTIRAMVEAHQDNHRFFVITSNRDWGVREPLEVRTDRLSKVGSARVSYGADTVFGMFVRTSKVLRTRPKYLYLNSAFDLPFSVVPLVAARLLGLRGARVVIAPRGEFGEGALRQKYHKKKIFLRVARGLGLYRDVAWHASSDREREEVLALFPEAQVVVRENESRLPSVANQAERTHGELRVVFISRISPKKGLHRLLAALQHATENIIVDIYGSADDDGYLSSCVALASKVPAQVQVSFHGPLLHEQVLDAFAGADLFAFPTSHENFGHVIAEALSVSTPVFVPDVTPWTQRLSAAGIAVLPEDDPQAWATALDRYATLDAAGRRKVRAKAAQVYDEWVAGRAVESVFEILEV